MIDGLGNAGFFGASAASTCRTSPPSPMAREPRVEQLRLERERQSG